MKVIIAIDDSPYSRNVVNQISRRRWPADTEFKLLTVLEPISLQRLSKDRWSELLANVSSSREHGAQQLCSDARDALLSHMPNARVHYDIRAGKASTQIVNAATEWGADKIMVGAHGRGVCPRFLLGSVSSAVAAHAHCSVEIVRAGAQHQQAPASDKKATARA